MGNYKHWVVNIVASEKSDLQIIFAQAKNLELSYTLPIKSNGDFFASIFDLNIKTSSRWENEHAIRTTEFLEWLEEFQLNMNNEKDGYVHWIAIEFGEVPSKIAAQWD